MIKEFQTSYTLSDKNSADIIFGGQKYSADKIFGTDSNFRHFCPPKIFVRRIFVRLLLTRNLFFTRFFKVFLGWSKSEWSQLMICEISTVQNVSDANIARKKSQYFVSMKIRIMLSEIMDKNSADKNIRRTKFSADINFRRT